MAVAERLSWHDSHIFATLAPPSGFLPEGTRGRAGFDAFRDIDFFIENINKTLERTRLEPIPEGLVRPHMFRKTMAIITAQQPDGEIALGIQLKHAARRALANRVTAGYGRMDANWSKEFDNQLELAAARKLVELLKARRQGDPVAVGPGAARLHAGLDKVIKAMDSDPHLQAQIVDERMQVSLLRDEFAQLHFGMINHCLWQASTAECQNQLPPEQRGQAAVARRVPAWQMPQLGVDLEERPLLDRRRGRPTRHPATRTALPAAARIHRDPSQRGAVGHRTIRQPGRCPLMPVSAATATKLREAMARLLAGEPLHTNGALTKENLAREAQVSHATVHRAEEILAEWDAKVARPRSRSNGQLST
ncbi:hypothetical protein [Streptomyces wuyuanensis]|uniref:hypothetical protein n=1 Tax=Streptomyces wuyuanensis TaxID=1196353 RepID=UPI00341FC7BA